MNEETIKKMTDWILSNRRGDAFKGYPPNKISNLIKHSLEQNVFVVSVEDGKMNGIACGERHEKEHYIFIHDVLTTKPGIVRKFIEYCLSLYPDYPIYGMAHGRYRLIHNPVKFARRIK